MLLSVPTRALGKTTSSSPDPCLRLPILRHDASVLLVKGERKGRRLVVELQGSEVKVKVIDAAVSLSAVLL